MILLKILATDEAQAHDLAEVLLRERLWVDPFIGGEQVMLQRKDQVITENGRILVQGMTRASLYTRINERLRQLYPYQMPIVFAVPIVSMDWEQSRHLIEDTTDEE